MILTFINPGKSLAPWVFSSRTGVISLIYNKGDQDMLQTTDSSQNLDYKLYAAILKNCM